MTVYEIVTYPLYGAVVLSGEYFIYTPSEDYVGPDSFVYRVIVGGLIQKERRVCLTVVS